MGNKKITITVDEDQYEWLSKTATEKGFVRSANLVRYLAINGIADEAEISSDKKLIQIKVDNYKDITEYVKGKKLTSVEVFAVYAMAQYMDRSPLTEAQKQRVE